MNNPHTTDIAITIATMLIAPYLIGLFVFALAHLWEYVTKKRNKVDNYQIVE